MIRVTISGLKDVSASLEAVGKSYTDKQFDSAVKSATVPIVNELRRAYSEHDRTGTLSNSIQSYQRKKTGRGSFFAYYVGARYTGGVSKKMKGTSPLIKHGGNIAHILEYGTIERFKPNVKLGGIKTSGKRIYGATSSTGSVRAYGIVRRTYDTMRDSTYEILRERFYDALNAIVKRAKLNLK